jgi:hypothetical protein
VALAETQLDDLRHMVGAQPHIRKRDWGFRNHYAASKGSLAELSMLELQRLGYVTEGRTGEELVFFHCTELGCKAAGLNERQTRRALDGE